MTPVPNLTDGLCAKTDDPRFFAGEGTRAQREAKNVCLSCPVMMECLEYAVQVGVDGIWGGTDLVQRKRLRATRGIVAESVLPLWMWSSFHNQREYVDYDAWEPGVCEVTGLEASPAWHRRTEIPFCEPCLEVRRVRKTLRTRELTKERREQVA